MNYDKIKLYCIPYSGGNFNSYAEFKKYLPHHIDLVNLELPGRGKRSSEPLLHTIEEMVLDLFEQIANNPKIPFAIYGHSLGALLGVMLCRYIFEKGYDPPERLFVSGQTAPALLGTDSNHLLPDKEFINMIREMGGTPVELLDDEGFMKYFLPVIRADFESIGNFTYDPESKPLDIPVTVMIGRNEKITDEEAERWQYETSKKISIHKYSGGHFFIFDNMENICHLIIDKLDN